MYNAHCPTHSHKLDDPPKKSLDNIINLYHCKVIRNEDNKNIIQENKKKVVILKGTKSAKNLQSFKSQSTYPERSSNIRQQNCNRVVTNNSLKIWV